MKFLQNTKRQTQWFGTCWYCGLVKWCAIVLLHSIKSSQHPVASWKVFMKIAKRYKQKNERNSLTTLLILAACTLCVVVQGIFGIGMVKPYWNVQANELQWLYKYIWMNDVACVVSRRFATKWGTKTSEKNMCHRYNKQALHRSSKSHKRIHKSSKISNETIFYNVCMYQNEEKNYHHRGDWWALCIYININIYTKILCSPIVFEYFSFIRKLDR